MNLDVTIVALGAGFAYGTAGYSHHLVEDISAISPLPNVRIFSPADVLETEAVVHEVVNTFGPKYVRLGKGGEGNLTAEFNKDTKGFSISAGLDSLVVLSTGNILSEALKVREFLPGASPTIASCYEFSELPKYLAENHFEKIITLEEHVLRGGFGSLVKEFPFSNRTSVSSIAIADIDSHLSGSQKHLRMRNNLTAEAISKLL